MKQNLIKALGILHTMWVSGDNQDLICEAKKQIRIALAEIERGEQVDGKQENSGTPEG